jgi:hypothetical protein
VQILGRDGAEGLRRQPPRLRRWRLRHRLPLPAQQTHRRPGVPPLIAVDQQAGHLGQPAAAARTDPRRRRSRRAPGWPGDRVLVRVACDADPVQPWMERPYADRIRASLARNNPARATSARPSRRQENPRDDARHRVGRTVVRRRGRPGTARRRGRPARGRSRRRARSSKEPPASNRGCTSDRCPTSSVLDDASGWRVHQCGAQTNGFLLTVRTDRYPR